MKRILAVTLTLVMLLATLTGCMASKNPSGNEGEQPELAQCLSEENGVYKLTLPKSKEVIELYEEQVRFVPYITDALVEVAESKITEDVSQHSNHSNFFLQITNDYLCLVVEVIKSIDPPVSAEEGEIADGGCGIDHEHLFFSERISSKAVADNKELHFGTSDEDYGKIQFFPQPTLEFTEEDTYDTTVLEWTRLTDGDMDLLRQVYNDGKGWIDDSVVDRVPFYFDGRIRFATMDSCGWMYFGIDQNVLYYNGMFTQINSKVLYIIEKAQNTISGSDNSSQENDYLVNHIQIKSGDNTIHPFGCMTWSKIDNDDGTFTESFVDKYDVIDLVSGKTPFAITDIPKLVLNDKVSYFVQVNGRVEKVYLLTPNDDTYTKSETTFDALSNLANGTYYVVLEVLLSGNCDPDAPQNSYRYEDVFCLVVGEQKPTNQNSILIESLNFSQYLNDVNFVPGLSQGSFIHQVEGYAYNDTAVTDIIAGMNYDGPSGGGWQATGDLFGFYNDYKVTDDEKYANYSNSLYSKVQLKGLPLPYNIKFGDSLDDVFEVIGIGLDQYGNFTPDKNSDTDITLYSNDTETLLFQNLKLTKEPVDYEFPFVLTYTETYNVQQDGGKSIVVHRVIKLSFDDDANLGLVEISVNETRELE